MVVVGTRELLHPPAVWCSTAIKFGRCSCVLMADCGPIFCSSWEQSLRIARIPDYRIRIRPLSLSRSWSQSWSQSWARSWFRSMSWSRSYSCPVLVPVLVPFLVPVLVLIPALVPVLVPVPVLDPFSQFRSWSWAHFSRSWAGFPPSGPGPESIFKYFHVFVNISMISMCVYRFPRNFPAGFRNNVGLTPDCIIFWISWIMDHSRGCRPSVTARSYQFHALLHAGGFLVNCAWWRLLHLIRGVIYIYIYIYICPSWHRTI